MQLVKERSIAVAGGEGKRGLGQGGIDRGRIVEILARDLAGLGNDGGIFAEVAEQAEEWARNSRVLSESASDGAGRAA